MIKILTVDGKPALINSAEILIIKSHGDKTIITLRNVDEAIISINSIDYICNILILKGIMTPVHNNTGSAVVELAVNNNKATM